MSQASSQSTSATNSRNGDTISGGGFSLKSLIAFGLLIAGAVVALAVWRGKGKGKK